MRVYRHGLLCLAGAAWFIVVGRAAEPLPSSSTVTLAAAGDVLLARGVQNALLDVRGQLATDLSDRLRDVRAVLRGADIAFANLECPLSAEGSPVPKPFSFRAHPAMVEVLRQAGVSLVSLANNHSLDCGKSGLEDTMRALTTAGVDFVGAGSDLPAARRPVVIRRRGLRIAFLAYSDFPPEGIVLIARRPGIAMADPVTLSEDIRRARAKADGVIVSFHGGREYSPHPSERQRRFVEAAVDAGADIVLGHHPHVLQPLEWRSAGDGRRAFVAWSLGNFIFDSRRLDARETGVLRFVLGESGVIGVTFTPMVVHRSLPRFVPATEAAERIDSLARLSPTAAFAPAGAGPMSSYQVRPR